MRNKVVCDVRVSFPLVVDEEKSLKYEQFIFDFFFIQNMYQLSSFSIMTKFDNILDSTTMKYPLP